MLIQPIVQWHSLKTRVTLVTVVIFVISLWSLTFYASRVLRADMQRQLGEQEFMSVSLIADHLNEELISRMQALQTIASELTPVVMGKRTSLQTLLEQRPLLQMLFNGGVFATDGNGTAIADVPISAGRIGTNYIDRDSVAVPLRQGKPMFGRPAMGKKLGAPIFSITVPIRDAQGAVSGVLVGTINLGKPNFFDKIVSRNYGKTGNYYLMSREHRLFVTSSNKERIMQPLPAPGTNLFLDKVLLGYEGYGLATSSRGIEALVAAKAIPSADWFISATLPTAEAFAPIDDMLHRIFLAAIFFTVLAAAITWWTIARLLHYQFAPVMTVTRALRATADAEQALLALPLLPLMPVLPVLRQDEIGEMISGFNQLLQINAQREAALKDSDAFGRGILDSVDAEIAVVDGTGMILAVNEPWRRFARENSADAGKPLATMEVGANYLVVCAVHSNSADANALAVGEGIRSVLSGAMPRFSTEYACHSKQKMRWFSLTVTPLMTLAHGGAVIVHTDISERKTAQEQIQKLAFSDPLTGLPNRRLLLDRLQQAIAASARHGRRGALLLIDLDDFKTINDTLGHQQGDALLQEVAQRLTSCIREVDTVARFGGDEFVVMLADLSPNTLKAATQIRLVAEKIRLALNQPYRLNNTLHSNTPSIGIALFGEQAEEIDAPLTQADLALYQAKGAGGNTLRFFAPRMQTEVANRVALEATLRKAVLKQQFVLHYQAQVTSHGQVAGAEALLRWDDPQLGLVLPTEFIAMAEKTGLILPLGRWVLETACHQLAQWAKRPELAHLSMAVNVSSRQFRQVDFVEQVLGALAHSGARADLLKIELTESLLVINVEDVIAKMSLLQARGIAFSLDDFGTGYSSLAYLKRLPLDQLKIDQGFVQNILTDANDAAIAKMVIALAETLGLQVIAEGVETEAQRDFLAGLGCHNFQGYLFGRALPIQDFEQLLQAA